MKKIFNPFLWFLIGLLMTLLSTYETIYDYSVKDLCIATLSLLYTLSQLTILKKDFDIEMLEEKLKISASRKR
jgi:hypothetical protein